MTKTNIIRSAQVSDILNDIGSFWFLVDQFFLGVLLMFWVSRCYIFNASWTLLFNLIPLDLSSSISLWSLIICSSYGAFSVYRAWFASMCARQCLIENFLKLNFFVRFVICNVLPHRELPRFEAACVFERPQIVRACHRWLSGNVLGPKRVPWNVLRWELRHCVELSEAPIRD